MVINTGGGCASILHRDETNSWEVQFLVQAWSAGTGCVRPNNNVGLRTVLQLTNGKLFMQAMEQFKHQTNAYKVKQGFTDIEECYEMIKDTDIYNYIMLSQNKEDLSKNRLGKLALSSSQEQVNVHMGIMAQDIQKYKCSKQILVEDKYERADGSTDTMLNVNPYGLTTAVMGALKLKFKKENY